QLVALYSAALSGSVLQLVYSFVCRTVGRLDFRYPVRDVLGLALPVLGNRSVLDPPNDIPPMLRWKGHAGMPKDPLELRVLLRPNLRIAGDDPHFKQDVPDVTMLPFRDLLA